MVLDTPATFFMLLSQAAQRGRKFTVATNSKGEAHLIMNYLHQNWPELKTKLYTSETGGKEKKAIGECNKTWLQYHVVVYTPALGCGVDFHELHFDYMFVYGICNSNTARDLKQMVGRVR